MSGGFPFGLDICNGFSMNVDAYGGGSGNPIGGSCTSGATDNTKGAWAEIISSTPSDICLLDFCFYSNSNDFTITALDIGIGSSGNELAIINNLMIQCRTTFTPYCFPINIPAGSRLSMRSQAGTGYGGSTDTAFTMQGYDGAFANMDGCAGVDSIGFQSTSTFGTTVTPGTRAKGSWAQLVSSSTRDYLGFAVFLDNQNNSFNDVGIVDIGVGSSGNEVVIRPDLNYVMIPNGLSPSFSFIPIAIPAGTRIVSRAASYNADTVGITIYGAYQ